MARGTTLATLVEMVKAEIGYSLTTGVAVAEDTRIKLLLKQQQMDLAALFDWPFLQRTGDVLLAAGDRTATLPTTLDYERPVQVATLDSKIWRPLTFGISPEELTIWNSDDGDTADPIQRWKYSTDTTFEVWPRPATATTVRFTGQKKLSPLTADSHTADLDDLLLVLFTAAEILAGEKQADAAAKLARAQRRFDTLKAAYPKPLSVFKLHGGREKRSDRDFMGGTITDGSLANTAGGTYALGNGVDSGTVPYNFGGVVPASIILTVQKPAGGLTLVAALDGAARADGFDFSLTGATDSTGYSLHWEATLRE